MKRKKRRKRRAFICRSARGAQIIHGVDAFLDSGRRGHICATSIVWSGIGEQEIHRQGTQMFDKYTTSSPSFGEEDAAHKIEPWRIFLCTGNNVGVGGRWRGRGRVLYPRRSGRKITLAHSMSVLVPAGTDICSCYLAVVEKRGRKTCKGWRNFWTHVVGCRNFSENGGEGAEHWSRSVVFGTRRARDGVHESGRWWGRFIYTIDSRVGLICFQERRCNNAWKFRAQAIATPPTGFDIGIFARVILILQKTRNLADSWFLSTESYSYLCEDSCTHVDYTS